MITTPPQERDFPPGRQAELRAKVRAGYTGTSRPHRLRLPVPALAAAALVLTMAVAGGVGLAFGQRGSQPVATPAASATPAVPFRQTDWANKAAALPVDLRSWPQVKAPSGDFGGYVVTLKNGVCNPRSGTHRYHVTLQLPVHYGHVLGGGDNAVMIYKIEPLDSGKPPTYAVVLYDGPGRAYFVGPARLITLLTGQDLAPQATISGGRVVVVPKPGAAAQRYRWNGTTIVRA